MAEALDRIGHLLLAQSYHYCVKDHFCNMQIVCLLSIHFDGGVRGAFVGAP